MMDYPICLICREEIIDEFTVSPKCKCVVKYHNECYQRVLNTGILCPICRIMKERLIRIPSVRSICNYFFDFYINNPSPGTFIVFSIFCFFFVMIFIPYVLICLLMKSVKFDYRIIC